ncbi:fungal-specific transcription factor domain-containing protein [Lactarius vividus]|nr:fungal-specific transcription factor domain-containing protein [Lactarius vividus]
MPSAVVSDHKSPMSPPSLTTTVEYKKDGTVSRMRSHRGNIPQLPQTKLCPFCPAKFTRTTHLNRHLRNHTNERLYRCEVCNAQFTRSDLLARHKRSCGESHPISRSRKRSCQACTSLKVKCDLRQPCSKCRARGRDCLYVTEEGQGESTLGSSSPQQFPGAGFSGPIVSIDASAGFDPSLFGRSAPADFATAFPELSLIEETTNAFSRPLSEANLASFMAGAPRIPQSAVSLPTIDVDSNITTSSIRPAPNYAFSAFGASEVAGHSRALHGFSPTMFEPFFRDIFSVEEETSHQNDHGAAPLLHPPDLETLVNELDQSNSTQPLSDGVSSLDMNLDSGLMSDLMSNTYYDNTQAPLMTHDSQPATVPTPSPLSAPPSAPAPEPHRVDSSYLTYDLSQTPLYTHQDVERFIPPLRPIEDGPAEPTTEELQKYLYIFLTAFLPQVPIIHTPTLRFELKPPMMLRAMQACGALFVRTPVAQAFVEKTLDTSRELIIRDLTKPSSDPKHQIHAIMTLILLQTIGLFHQDPHQRASSNIYHGMLILMIRQNRLIERVATWEHQPFPATDPAVLDAMWRGWAMHETLKRVVCLGYCLDQAHRIYFSLAPSFSPAEFTMCLPCEEELWAAKTAHEWAQLLLNPSPYGSIEERLYGVPMPRALIAVGLEGSYMTTNASASPEPPLELSAVSPFGHFILTQTLLAELFSRCSGANSQGASPTVDGEEQVNEHVHAMLLALHRWLQMWLKTPNASPNAIPPGGTAVEQKTGLMSDPLPFYWLAQLLLLAFQEGLPPFRKRETSPASPTSAPYVQALHEPSPFAPPTTPASSPFSPSPFAPSPFSTSSLSSGSSPVTASTLPPAYGVNSLSPGMYKALGGGINATPDAAQFRLVKSWLHHIRLFLRRSKGSPTVVWDELMKIRLSGWQEDAVASSQEDPLLREAQKDGGGADDSGSWAECDGLIGFFEEKMHM